MTDFTVIHIINTQTVADLVTSAIEGGSGYWLDRVRPRYNGHEEYSEASAYGTDMVERNFYADGEARPLNRDAIQRGLSLMPSVAGGRHWANLISDNADAETADVFLQLCLFGDIVYG